jgi:Ca2+-binding RTX toxin-like protein
MARKPNTQTGMLEDNDRGTNDTLSVTAPPGGTLPPATDPTGWLFGDALEMTGSARGGNDVFIVEDGAGARLRACGDAFMMGGHSRGGNDVFIGRDGGPNVLCGDTCEMSDYARGGNDTLIGGDGVNNSLIGDCRILNDHTRGGNDVLIAGNGPGTNTMYGDASVEMRDCAVGGNDTLISGTAVDNMWGDGAAVIGTNVTTGADTFVFAPGNNADTINDFRKADHDKIDVSAYGFDNITDLVITDLGSDTLIDFGGGNSVKLVGIADPSILSGCDFIFA